MSNTPKPKGKPLTPAQSLLLFLKAMGLAALMAALITAGDRQARAQSSTPDGNRVALAAGSVIPVTLNNALSSGKSTHGDAFTATVDTTRKPYDQILRGATVIGVVREADPRTESEPGRLDLSFTSLRLADGRMCALKGSLASLDPSQITTGANGLLTAENASEVGRLVYAGVGPGAGALVDMTGDNYKIEDRLAGDPGDAAVGDVLHSPAHIQDVVLKPGTAMGVLLGSQVVFFKRPQEAALKAIFHRIYPQKGMKYYRYNGQSWVLNLATGQRYPVSTNTDQTSPGE